MLKRFFISFLASVAGVCVAGFILMITFFAIIGYAAMKSDSSSVQLTKNSVLKIDLSGMVDDREESVPLMERLRNNIDIMALNDIVKAIETAADDDKIDGIYLECNGVSAGLAQLEAIRTAITKFKESGKWVYAYGDSYSQGDYYLATTADSIYINPEGMVDIHGLASTVLYFKDFLAKVGVKMQVVKVGTYKSAVEPFLLSDMSEANREQLDLLLGNMWSNMVNNIAQARGVDSTAVNQWADSFCFTQPTKTYLENKIVDRIVYKHDVTEMLTKITDKEKEPNYVDYTDYLTLNKQKQSTKGKKIAVLYATGDITEDGEGGIASDRLVPEIMDLIDDDDIAGLIMRVNSGGGSAYASEQIWEALEQFKERTGKPFYVSMGDYAASGGYYISCGANKIYAEPLTLTGSIGIFGMIPDAQELFNNKLGINSATVATNTGAPISFYKSMTPEQTQAMQAYVDRGYETFTSRCATGRHMSIDAIKAIAEGRVWDGAKALELGLVDKMGGLDVAIRDMAKELDAKDYYVEEYPKIKRKWYDELMSLNSQIRERSLKAELGDAYIYYQSIKSFTGMHPLQCRMDYIQIK